jgi:hypothetical protein
VPDPHELADHLFTTFEGGYLLCRHWTHRSRCEPSCGYSGNCSRTCSLPANGLPPPTVQLPRFHLTHRHVRRCRKPFHLLDAVSSARTDRGKCGPSAVKFRDLRHAEPNRDDRFATPAAGNGFPTFAVAVIAGRRSEAVAGSALEYTALVGQHDGLRAVPHVQFLQ